MLIAYLAKKLTFARAGPDWQARSPFVQALRTLGWVEGHNLVLEYRWAEGQPERV